MYEPKIVGFLCTWCSYTGADSAGIARMKYPANLRAIRVPCSGRISPELIMRAFDQGADGVIVLGCHIGECHYDSGNHRTAKRIPVLRTLMTFAGLEPDRLRLDWVSASEGDRYSRIVNEFTEQVRALGPIQWKMENRESRFDRRSYQLKLEPGELVDTNLHHPISDHHSLISNIYPQITNNYTMAIQDTARHLLQNGEVDCVIGYEVGPRGRTRPVFVYDTENTHRLVWNEGCTHNLATYLPGKFSKAHPANQPAAKPVAVVAKACDTRAINVQLAENLYSREQVHVLGVVCPGILDPESSPNTQGDRTDDVPHMLQPRCQNCTHREPQLYDTLIGELDRIGEFLVVDGDPGQNQAQLPNIRDWIVSASPAERLEFWLNQFDRCLRCYACRQACPSCNCPTCLYERDDSLWVGMGIGVNEKRTFHLGRAFHLAGRCVGCDECERVCPVGLPISLLNQCLSEEISQAFGYRAGTTTAPPPLITLLREEEV